MTAIYTTLEAGRCILCTDQCLRVCVSFARLFEYLALSLRCRRHVFSLTPPTLTDVTRPFGSRNKKRKAPRAVWYGITFVKYALHM